MGGLGTKRGLKARCQELRATVLELHAASEAEVAAYWPGGSDNPTASFEGWIFCYASLVRFMGRTETSHESQALDLALARQLARQPIPVRLADGSTQAVYPQSYHALRFLDTLDRELVLLTSKAEQVDVSGIDGAAVAMVMPLLESLAVRLWAWILTSDGRTESGLPFDDAGEAPEPPAWTKRLTGTDLLALAAAHAQVNQRDLQVIAVAFPGTSGPGSRLTLAGFIGTASEALNARPFEVMRRWSLGELFAQRVTAAEAARAAAEQAKAEAA